MVCTYVTKHYSTAQCGILAAPINGSVEQTGTVEGSTTTYQCVAGYILNLEIGDEVRTCTEEGVWSGDMPECDRTLYEISIILIFCLIT